MKKKDQLTVLIRILWIITLISTAITLLLNYIGNKYGNDFFVPVSLVLWVLLAYAISTRYVNGY